MNVNKVWNELYTKRKMLEFVENLSAYDGLGSEGPIQNKVLQKWALVSSK